MNYLSERLTCERTRPERRFLLLVVIINLVLKVIPAGLLELGNDEVYYWTYALFPDWSHFDHPLMVGLLIQLFSLNLTFQGELLMRLGPLILSSTNIVILFYLVKKIYSVRAAHFAVILFISSFYFNILSGFLILPDAPQVFFVLLAMYFLLQSITSGIPTKREYYSIVLFGMFTGLAFLSKYHSLFLWFGAGFYILIYNRTWLKRPALYISFLFTLVLMVPVLYWNWRNDFISFTFHGNRVGLFQNPVNFVSFMRFSLGQIFYQNPFCFIIYTFALFKVIKNLRHGIKGINLLLLWLGLPLIFIFTFISIFRNTLPHWSGPAFLPVIILSSEYLAELYIEKRDIVIRTLSIGLVFFVIVLAAGTLQIKYGLVDLETDSGSIRPGKNDFTLDMFGWKQAGEKFALFLEKEGISEDAHNQVALISDNWYPAAHFDYYVATPLKIRLIALGGIESIHKYYWINQMRKLRETDRIFFVTDSRNYRGPEKYSDCFSGIIPRDTLVISRNQKTVKLIYIYDMVDYKCDTILSSPHPGF